MSIAPESTPSGFQAGTILEGRYRLTQVVGQTVVVESYFGSHLGLGRSVYIDVLADLTQARAFHRAARRLASMRHPNVATVHDFGVDPGSATVDPGSVADGRPYVVLEDVGTNSLREQLRVHGPFTSGRFASVARQLLSALGYMHGKKILHRAVAPHSVFVVESWNGTVIKLARFAYLPPPEVSSGQVSKAAHRALMASLACSAPESLLGDHVDLRADLYSAGCVLYRLLTGESPFPGSDFAEVGRAVIESTPRSLLDFEIDVSPELDRAIYKALEKKPERRYASATEMWAAIWHAMPEQRATLRPPH